MLTRILKFCQQYFIFYHLTSRLVTRQIKNWKGSSRLLINSSMPVNIIINISWNISQMLSTFRFVDQSDLSVPVLPDPHHLGVHHVRGEPDPAQLPGVRHLDHPKQANLHHTRAAGPIGKVDAGQKIIISPAVNFNLNLQGTSDDPRAPLAGNLRPTQPNNGRLVRTNINFEQTNDLDCKEFSAAFKYQATNIWATHSFI